jgi:predicted enzyme related to lactoylglutathione lyase
MRMRSARPGLPEASTGRQPIWQEECSSVNFNSILIGSEDPARLAEFYTRLFGAPVMSEGGYTGWMIGSGFVTVGPHSEVSGRNREPGRVIWNIESTAVEADFERFRSAGAEVIAEPYSMEGMPADTWIATLADPDGNYFQLMSPFDGDAVQA